LAPTIALLELAAFEVDSLPWSPLVPIQPAGDKPPSSASIQSWCLSLLRIGTSFRTTNHFMDCNKLDLTRTTPYTGIEDMATHYIKALHIVQPQGPYFWEAGLSEVWLPLKWLNSCFRQGIRWLYLLIDTIAPVSSNQPSLRESLKFSLTQQCDLYGPMFLIILSHDHRQTATK